MGNQLQCQNCATLFSPQQQQDYFQSHRNLTGLHSVTYPDNSTYQGQFHRGKRQGKGIYNSNDGRSYQGYFHQDKAHGKGKYIDQKGSYQGDWLFNLRHGFGVQKLNNGERYQGQFSQGKYHGRGKYVYQNGCQYIGDFSKGLPEGRGVFNNFSDETKFQGFFKQGKPLEGIQWKRGKIIFQGKMSKVIQEA